MKDFDRLPIGEGYEDINKVVLQIAKNKELGMSQIQDELKKIETNIEEGDFDNIGLIPSFLQAVLAGLLCVLGDSYKQDNLYFTARCIAIQSKCLFHKKKINKVLSFLQENENILSEIELYGSNNINILKVLSQIKLIDIKARIEIDTNIEDSLVSAINILRLFCISSELEKDKLAANLYMSDLADLLALKGKTTESINIYKELFEIFPLDSYSDKKVRNAATLAFGHYVQAVIVDESISDDEKESLCLQEVGLFQKIALEEQTAKSYFDLAIACAHISNFYFDSKKISAAADWVLKKFKLISFAIKLNTDGNPDIDAINERLSQSFINSCQMLINCALLSTREEKISYITSAISILIDILENYEDDIRLYSYANAFADELFKEHESSNEIESAEVYLRFKLRTVFELLNRFPRDQALLHELYNTLVMGNSFVQDNWGTIDGELQEMWQHCRDSHIFD